MDFLSNFKSALKVLCIVKKDESCRAFKVSVHVTECLLSNPYKNQLMLYNMSEQQSVIVKLGLHSVWFDCWSDAYSEAEAA